jgi:hypothetical protein
MRKLKELILAEKTQYQVFLGLSIVVLGLTGIVFFADKQPFERFIGSFNPLLAALLIVVLGGILLTLLLSREWFAIYKKGNRKGFYLSTGLAAIFGAIMILVDSKIRFPADLNISFPESLLFYPAIGYLVEVLLHVLPLTLLLIALSSILKDVRHEKVVLISIVIVSLLEPLYQTVYIASPEWFPLWAQAYIGVHIFLINLSQLFIFKRYDFLSMYSFRLVYYLFWHIGWGYIRLKVLF